MFLLFYWVEVIILCMFCFAASGNMVRGLQHGFSLLQSLFSGMDHIWSQNCSKTHLHMLGSSIQVPLVIRAMEEVSWDGTGEWYEPAKNIKNIPGCLWCESKLLGMGKEACLELNFSRLFPLGTTFSTQSSGSQQILDGSGHHVSGNLDAALFVDIWLTFPLSVH